MADEARFVSRGEFLQHAQSVKLQIEGHAIEIGKLRERAHEIPTLATGLKFATAMIEKVMDDLKEIPRKQDLDNLKTHVDEKFDTLKEQRNEHDKRVLRLIAILGLIISAVSALTMIVLKVLKIG